MSYIEEPQGTKELSPIDREFKKINENLAILEEGLSLLEGRLYDYALPESAATGESSQEQPPIGGKCRVLFELEGINECIQRLDRGNRDFLSRLQV